MTGPQADWLRKHPQYRAVGNTPSQHRWTQRGMLAADGVFTPIAGGQRPRVTEGAFEVGVLTKDPAFERRA